MELRTRPGAGIPPGKFLSTVKEMAGRWEVGEDAGLHSLAKSVEQAGEVREVRQVVMSGFIFHQILPKIKCDS